MGGVRGGQETRRWEPAAGVGTVLRRYCCRDLGPDRQRPIRLHRRPGADVLRGSRRRRTVREIRPVSHPRGTPKIHEGNSEVVYGWDARWHIYATLTTRTGVLAALP